MKRALIAVGILLLSGCGYDGHYRYECQDPANWENEECNPPVCLVDGMCTENLLGFNPKEVAKVDPKEVTEMDQEEVTEMNQEGQP